MNFLGDLLDGVQSKPVGDIGVIQAISRCSPLEMLVLTNQHKISVAFGLFSLHLVLRHFGAQVPTVHGHRKWPSVATVLDCNAMKFT